MPTIIIIFNNDIQLYSHWVSHGHNDTYSHNQTETKQTVILILSLVVIVIYYILNLMALVETRHLKLVTVTQSYFLSHFIILKVSGTLWL